MPKGLLSNGCSTASHRKTVNLPTEHPSTWDIAWAAGIYEGEGSCANTCKDLKQGTQEVSILQKDRELLDRLRVKFGGRVDWSKARGSKNHAVIGTGCFRWRLSGCQARGFLQTIFILLTNRRHQQILKLGFMNQEA